MNEPASPPASGAFPRWRLALALFGAISALLLVWYFLAFRDEYVLLYEDIRPADAAPVVAELERQHVRYRLDHGGTAILVPAQQADSLRVHFAGADIAPSGAAGFELFDTSDMGLTEFAQKIKYQRALQGELTRTILMMDGVLAARVHISTPERSLFRGDQRPAHAAVTLLTRAPEDEAPSRIEGIQRLVAAAVADLSPANVVVLNGRGEVLSSTLEHLGGAAFPVAQPIALMGGANSDDTSAIEVLGALIGRALPNQRFEVAIEHVASAQGEAGTRIIAITTQSALPSIDMERLRELLRDAALMADGDTLSFQSGLSPAHVSTVHEAEAATSPTSDNTHRPNNARPSLGLAWSALTIGGPVLLALAALALLWMRRRKQKPLLSEDQHARFADQLREGLKAEEAEREPV